MPGRFCLPVAVAAAFVTCPVGAKERVKRPEPAKPACARAAYVGDPVCDLGDADRNLPTPSSRTIRRAEEGSAFVLKDGVAIDGKTNFNENRFGEAPLHKLTPRPRSKASTNGGAQIDFQF